LNSEQEIMNCSFTEKISSLIDGELSPVEAREVERHLHTCAQCEEVRADFLNLRSQISSYEASLPGQVQNRGLAKILAGRQRAVSGHGFSGWGWNWGYSAVALASIAILALIIGLNFYRGGEKDEKVAVQSHPVAPSPVASPAPSPEPEPAKNEKEPETSRPAQPKPVRRSPAREPKPGEQFAGIPEPARIPEPVRPADAQTMTALHFEKTETLLRAFRNVRLDDPDAASEVDYERRRAKQLVYQNMMLRREADASGDIQIASLLENLEPILLDIANLPAKPDDDAVRVIRERVERKNIVALLQINSTALARALDD
ncbi:MAG TPA: zf-HC2 domain-containing protein, partial [Pyrinomonadaceae bacterium]|nr:zf-HC2 domain-containing protein [Pyrinomonadaceae bacterium]